VLATAGLRSGQMWPWLALWVMPVFFAAHVALLGIWIPDGVLLVLSVVALVATRPSRAPMDVGADPRPVGQSS
jgi:hypothetical protein